MAICAHIKHVTEVQSLQVLRGGFALGRHFRGQANVHCGVVALTSMSDPRPAAPGPPNSLMNVNEERPGANVALRKVAVRAGMSEPMADFERMTLFEM